MADAAAGLAIAGVVVALTMPFYLAVALVLIGG